MTPPFGLALAAALAAAVPQAPPPPVFQAGVEAVYVDVFVTARNAPVEGLTAADFEVFDDGVRQEPTLVALDSVAVSAVLVFDTSRSVEGARLRELKDAGRAFVEGLAPRDTAALVTFDTQFELRTPPTAGRETVARALEQLEAGGATRVLDALYLALEKTWPGRPLVVLFTDGADTVSWLEPEEVLAAARDSSALLYVLTPAAERVRSLREMAEVTGGRLFAIEGTKDVERALLEVLAAMKARYLLGYEPRGVPHGGAHQIRVRVKNHGPVEVHNRREYRVRARPR